MADDERIKRQDKKFDKLLSIENIYEKYGNICLPEELKCRSFESDCIENDVVNRLRDCLNKLLTNEKQCLIRYYYQKLPIKEIAILENMSERNVKRYIKSAKEKLKKLVE